MTLHQDYSHIFTHRGDSYAQAMAGQPSARDAEFRTLFHRLNPAGLGLVADVPSGGSYLSPYLPRDTVLHAYDPAQAFRDAGQQVYPVDLGAPKLMRDDYDLIVSLASIHHVEAKEAFFRDLAAHVRPGGAMVLADVAASSKVSGFLDDFIGTHNGTGHEGWFLSSSDPFDFGRGQAGIAEAFAETLDCPWRFQNLSDMADFCRLLFGTAGLSREAMVDGLDRYIGFELGGHGVRLDWELTYITVFFDG